MHHAGQLREERRALVASLEYAFAMGRGCSIGGHPDRREIGQRAAQPLGAWAGEPIATARREAPTSKSSSPGSTPYAAGIS
jgi:hypothetical protein